MLRGISGTTWSPYCTHAYNLFKSLPLLCVVRQPLPSLYLPVIAKYIWKSSLWPLSLSFIFL